MGKFKSQRMPDPPVEDDDDAHQPVPIEDDED